MATGEAGYDYYFVEPPPERLLCNVCRLPCREAQVSEDLVYCKRCVPESCFAGVKPFVNVSTLQQLNEMLAISRILFMMHRWIVM